MAQESSALQDLQELVEMLFISRQIDSMRGNKEEKKLWRSKAGLSNKDFKEISMVARMFLGYQYKGTYAEICASCFGHAKSFLRNSTDKIDGCDISYSRFKTFMQMIRSSVFDLSPKKDDGIISEVSFYHQQNIPSRISTKETNHQFCIDIWGVDGKVYKYGFAECFGDKFLSYKPYKMTLADYLVKNPLSRRRAKLFDSLELYPNRYVKGLIQGLLTAAGERSTDGKGEHGYLIHPENVLLHEPVYPPYPPSYLSLPKLSAGMEKILHQAMEQRQYVVPVSFVHATCETYMEDVSALQDLIFNQILNEGCNPLPPDWKLFKKAFANRNDPLFFEKIVSHSVLWDWKKQQDLLIHAYHLKSSSTSDMQITTRNAMQHLDVLREDWCAKVQVEKAWDDVFTFNEWKQYRIGQVDHLVEFFRHLVTHVDVTSLPSKTKAHLAFKVSRLFPSLLPQINEILVELGIKY